jgi:hypothetical protein
MKSIILILISLLTSSGIAHLDHQHLQRQHKRQDVDENYVTETIDITTTICVQKGFVPLTVSSLSDEILTKIFQGTNTFLTSFVLPPTASTCSSSAYDSPTTSDAAAASVSSAPVESPSSSFPTVIGVAKYESTSVYNPPEATTSSAVALGATLSPSSSECTPEKPCKGDITYYTAGLGACGITSDGDVQNVVALPYGLMGPESNNNPYCGKTITITCIATGKTTTATVVDKCMGCDGFSIDLSNAAFLDLDDLAVGRTSATWYFN